MKASEEVSLPRVDAVPSSVATTSIARGLVATYTDALDEAVPEELTSILEAAKRREMNDPTSEPTRRVALIVEDDAHVRELATALLEETDLHVAAFETAEEALSFMHQRGNEVALIFADIRLPGPMDGAEFAKIACEGWPTVRVVVTSGDAGDRLEGLPPCVTFMPKPWRALEVLVQAQKAVKPRLPTAA